MRATRPHGTRGPREPLGEIFTRDFLLIATINLAMFFAFQMTTIGLPVYVSQLGAPTQVVGLIATFMAGSATVARIFAGPLLDRFGRGGMLIGGIALAAVTITAYAIFPIVGVILGVRLLHGLGWGVGSTATSTVAADIIPRRRFAEGMGYFAMTASISSALAPAVSVELVEGSGGPTMLFVSAGITCVALALAIIRMALARRDERRANAGDAPAPAIPSEAKDLPEAANGPAAAIPSEAKDLPAAKHANETAGQAAKPRITFDTVFERRAFLPSVFILLVNMGFGCVTTFIALHAAARGVEHVSLYFLVYAITTLVTRPGIGRLIDRFGYRIPAILATLCTAGTLVLIGLASTLAAFATAGLFAGLGIGTAMGTFQSMAVASVEPNRRGVATATYMTFFDIGIAVGAGLGGVIAGALGYGGMFMVVAAFPATAALLAALLVKPGVGVSSPQAPNGPAK